MKKINFIIFCLFLGLAFNSCSKDGAEKTSSLTCKVDGVVYTAATILSTTSNGLPGILILAEGATLSDPNLKLQINSEDPGITEPGFGTLYNDSQSAYFSDSGEIEITTSTDSEIRGTFYFTGANLFNGLSVEITEGKFTVYR